MELSKKESAEYLGISIRALERYTSQGLIGVKYLKAQRGKKAYYLKDDLDELKEKLNVEVHKPIIETSEKKEITIPIEQKNLLSLAEAIISPAISQLNKLTNAVEKLSSLTENKTTFSLSEKLLLTLPEVQKLTGLSREILKDAIDKKKLKAQIMGKSWRIKKTDLENYIDSL